MVRDMLRYLVAHPEAKDTVEGITRWWQPAGEPGWSAAEVSAALDFFARRSWVSVREAGSARLWSANPERVGEMRRFLDEMESGPQAPEKAPEKD